MRSTGSAIESEEEEEGDDGSAGACASAEGCCAAECLLAQTGMVFAPVAGVLPPTSLEVGAGEEEEGAVAGACASAEGCCAAVRLHARTGRPPAAGEALLALRPKAGADAGKEEDEEGAA